MCGESRGLSAGLANTNLKEKAMAIGRRHVTGAAVGAIHLHLDKPLRMPPSKVPLSDAGP